MLNRYVKFDSIKKTLITQKIDGQHGPTITLKQEHLNFLLTK